MSKNRVFHLILAIFVAVCIGIITNSVITYAGNGVSFDSQIVTDSNVEVAGAMVSGMEAFSRKDKDSIKTVSMVIVNESITRATNMITAVRSEPFDDAEITGRIWIGAPIFITEVEASDEEVFWLKVKTDSGIEGYLKSTQILSYK